jgi:hypothetical protein
LWNVIPPSKFKGTRLQWVQYLAQEKRDNEIRTFSAQHPGANINYMPVDTNKERVTAKLKKKMMSAFVPPNNNFGVDRNDFRNRNNSIFGAKGTLQKEN